MRVIHDAYAENFAKCFGLDCHEKGFTSDKYLNY